MHSPLPDSSALEAGIIEDERPSRLSRVQDNVRHLLRASFVSSPRSSSVAAASPLPRRQPAAEEDEDVRPPLSVPLPSPLTQHPVHAQPAPAVVPPSSSSSSSSASGSFTTASPQAVTYQQQVQRMAHQSSVFNTRAVEALTHPDLSDPSLALFLQQKSEARQRRAWKRSRNRRLRHATARRGGHARWLWFVFTGLLLSAVTTTYLVVATSSHHLSPAFHILFILGILLTTILFAHSFVRACFIRRTLPDSPKIYVVANGHQLKRRRHHRHHHRQDRDRPRPSPPASDDSPAEFVPPIAIPVRGALSDEAVRPDSREAQPSTGAERASRTWNKPVDGLRHPPPAYGRWRGSVRANPELLHWHAIPSPVDPDTPTVPSPTYEEATRAVEPTTGPPSYVTRESPARRRDIHDGRLGFAQAQAVEPEMVEGRGIGLAV